MTELEGAQVNRGSKLSMPRSFVLFLLVLLAVFPFMHPRGEQQASRFAATAAVWDLGTVEITEYAALIGRDGAFVEGVLYSDKAPGQPFLVVPLYGAYRLFGGEALRADTPRVDIGLWWLTVWSAGIPLAILAVLMYRWSSEIEAEKALAATLAVTFGTLLLVYGTILFAHVLAALLGFGMFLLVRKPDVSLRSLFLAGFLGGLAVLVEFPLALIVMVVTVGAFAMHRTRAWPLLAGGTPAVLMLGLYNWSVFGSPFVFSYQWNLFAGIQEEARGTLDIFAGPSFERLLHVLISERGLLIATPVVGVALIGLILMWRRGWRMDALIAGFAFLTMLAIQMSWGNSYAGGAGPRYVTPGLPFLAAPLAMAWARWRLITTGLAIFSGLTMLLATLTNPQLGSAFEAGLAYWMPELLQGNLAPTIYTEALGAWGWLVHLGTVAVASFVLVRMTSDVAGQMSVPTAREAHERL